jgi:hypothetical protein
MEKIQAQRGRAFGDDLMMMVMTTMTTIITSSSPSLLLFLPFLCYDDYD